MGRTLPIFILFLWIGGSYSGSIIKQEEVGLVRAFDSKEELFTEIEKVAFRKAAIEYVDFINPRQKTPTSIV
jgi:hypothetical protein